MSALAAASATRSGTHVFADQNDGGLFRPWAVGYASSPTRVGIATWSRWSADIEAYAAVHRMPLAGLYTDDDLAEGGVQFRRLLRLIRDRADQPGGRIGVLIVPDLDHLSWSRDATHPVVRHVLELHLGLHIQAVTDGPAAAGRCGPLIPGRRVPTSLCAPAGLQPEQPQQLERPEKPEEGERG